MPARGSCASFGIEVQQRVLQRAGRIAGARDARPAGGLVDHEHMPVLMDDVQVDRLRARPATASGRTALTSTRSPPTTLSFGPQLPAIDQNLAGLDPVLDASARILRQQIGQHLIQALPGRFEGNRQGNVGSGRSWGNLERELEADTKAGRMMLSLDRRLGRVWPASDRSTTG